MTLAGALIALVVFVLSLAVFVVGACRLAGEADDPMQQEIGDVPNPRGR